MNDFENKPLNTTDGWESIVNANAAQRSVARERVAARKLELRIKKLQVYVCALAVAGLAFVILGITGAVVSWLASIAASLSLYGACFLFGRLLEVRKK